MRVGVVHNNVNSSLQLAGELKELLKNEGFELDDENPEVVLTVGGDGTLLSAFRQYDAQLDRIRFVGIHTGHLGFYTDWRDYELKELVASLKNDTGASIQYPLLDVRIVYKDGRADEHFLALNESTIKSMDHMMVADVCIQDEVFERFRGDGLSIATPTGSTAYNKSIGGAVMHPSINALQLTEVASLNNRVYRTLGSPIIIPHHEQISIYLKDGEEYLVAVDQFSVKSKEVTAVHYKVAAEKIRFASYRHMHFWHRVHDAFIGQ